MLQPRHRALSATLRFLAAVALAAVVPSPILTAQTPAGPAQSGENFVKVIISFRDAPGAADEALVRGSGGRVKRRYHLINAIAASLPPQVATALRNHPRVAAVEPDVRIFAVDAELDNSWGVNHIGAGAVHTNGIRGAGVKVAVIDSGIDCTHPDLVGKCAGGWNFITNDADASDDNKHGTHVAGIIAAADDDAGVVGVAPDVQLYALKVLDANGTGDFSDVIEALQWAVDHGINITNNSYGSSQNPGTIAKAAFDNAAAAGILHIAAAGNSGTCEGIGDQVLYPARYDSVIAVGATDPADASPCFSSSGPKVELSAPGVSINSTVPGGYELLSGTSMASPHVAGVAALVIGNGVVDANGDSRINDDVRRILTQTAHDLGLPGRDTWFGFGLVDAGAAVVAAPPEPFVAATVSTNKSTFTQGVDTAAQLTVVVNDEVGASIVGLASSAFATTLDGSGAAVTFTEIAPGTYRGALVLAGLAAGPHSAMVSVTDTRGVSGAGAASFTIVVAQTVKVKSISYSTWGGLNGKRNLTISVLIVNGAGAPVSGGIVSVIAFRNGWFYGAANGMSGSNGLAVFDAMNAPAGCYQTLVAAVLAGTRSWDGATPPNQFCK